jgi:hypothetical protein
MNKASYWNLLKPLIPRILGQIDRDPDSPTYGSFDRNYWNYKIRDFSSAIIQQGILVLDVIYKYNSKENPYYQSVVIKELIEAGVNYWCKIQLKTGSFNEYYPNESGFPPTGFSLYAVSLLVNDKNYCFGEEINKAIEKAAAWILKNQEKEALNQECAAIAGICIAAKKLNINYNKPALDKRLKDFYGAQSSEGWFNEYDGPDIGYLSVTIDCLTDVYNITGDKRAQLAIEKAIKFINSFVTPEGYSPVMVNSRNTDYIVPFGISYAAQKNNLARDLVSKLFLPIKNWDNQLYKTDDRYLCHYIGQSFFRTLNNLPEQDEKIESLTDNPEEVFFEEAGIYCLKRDEKSLFISLRKGGVFTLFNKSGALNTDFGYRLNPGNNLIAVTHWQDTNYQIKKEKDGERTTLKVSGYMSQHKYLRPTPNKHMALRILSNLLGNKLIPFLKKQLIFREHISKFYFERKFIVFNNTIQVVDSFNDLNNNSVKKAKHYSMRHVSSAGRYCNEELLNENSIFEADEFPLKRDVNI